MSHRRNENDESPTELSDNDLNLPNIDLYTFTPDLFPSLTRGIESHLDVKNNLNKMLELLKTTSVELESLEMRDNLDDLENQVKGIIDNQEKCNLFNYELRNFQGIARSQGIHGLEDSIYEKVVTEHERELKKYLRKSKNTRYNQNEDYIDYKTKVWKVHHPNQPLPVVSRRANDDELVVEEVRESLKCPITTQFLEDPVMSSQCKHSFSRAAIEECIRSGRGSFTCPVAGCNKTIRQSYLRPNEELRKKVEEHLVKQSTQTGEQFTLVG